MNNYQHPFAGTGTESMSATEVKFEDLSKEELHNFLSLISCTIRNVPGSIFNVDFAGKNIGVINVADSKFHANSPKHTLSATFPSLAEASYALYQESLQKPLRERVAAAGFPNPCTLTEKCVQFDIQCRNSEGTVELVVGEIRENKEGFALTSNDGWSPLRIYLCYPSLGELKVAYDEVLEELEGLPNYLLKKFPDAWDISGILADTGLEVIKDEHQSRYNFWINNHVILRAKTLGELLDLYLKSLRNAAGELEKVAIRNKEKAAKK